MTRLALHPTPSVPWFSGCTVNGISILLPPEWVFSISDKNRRAQVNIFINVEFVILIVNARMRTIGIRFLIRLAVIRLAVIVANGLRTMCLSSWNSSLKGYSWRVYARICQRNSSTIWGALPTLWISIEIGKFRGTAERSSASSSLRNIFFKNSFTHW